MHARVTSSRLFRVSTLTPRWVGAKGGLTLFLCPGVSLFARVQGRLEVPLGVQHIACEQRAEQRAHEERVPRAVTRCALRRDIKSRHRVVELGLEVKSPALGDPPLPGPVKVEIGHKLIPCTKAANGVTRTAAFGE